MPSSFTPSSTRISRLIEGHQTRDALDRLEFLIEAGTLLASSLDYETTLRNVARLCVPYLGDWCLLYVAQPDGSIRRLTVEHAGPDGADVTAALPQITIDPRSPYGVARVIRTGASDYLPEANARMLSLDVHDVDAMERLLEPLGVSSWLCVPLSVHGRTLGAISLVYTGGRSYMPSDLALAEEIGRRAAIAVENARLFVDTQSAVASREEAIRKREELLRSEQQMRREVQAAEQNVRALYEAERAARAVAERNAELIARLHTVIAALGEALTIDEVAGRALEESLNALHARAGAVGVVTEGADAIEIVASEGFSESDRDAYRRFPLTAELPMSDAVRERRLVLLGNAAERRAAYPRFPEGDTPNPAIAVVPLLLEDRALGALAVTFADAREFDLDEQEFMLALGKHVAQALERARLYRAQSAAREAAEDFSEIVRRLQQLTWELAATVTSPDVAREVLELCTSAVGADSSVLMRIEGDHLRIVHAVNYEQGALDDWQTFPLVAPLPMSDAIAQRRSIPLRSREERDRLYPLLRETPTTREASIAIPLVVENGCVGGLTFSFEDARALDPDEIAFADAVAQQCAYALQRADSYTAERAARVAAEESEYRLAFLARATEILNSSLDHEVALSTLAELAVPELADWCIIDVLEDDRLRMVGIAHVDPSKLEPAREFRRRYPPQLDLPAGLGEVIRTGRAQLWEEVTEADLRATARDEEQFRMLLEVGFTSAMMLPIAARGRTLGVMTFVSAASGAHYDEDTLRFAEELAARAGVAVDNARLYAEARESQERLGDLVHSVDTIVWEADARTGEILFINGRAEDLIGYPLAQWRDVASWASFMHDDDRERVLATRRAAVREGRSHEIEYRVRTAEGQVRWLRDRVRVGGERGARRVYGISLDVTVEKQAESRRAAAGAVSAALADATTTADAASRILGSVCDLLAWDVGEVWLADEDGTLRVTEARYDPELAPIALAVRSVTLQSGIGIPGRVYASRAPVWMAPVRPEAETMNAFTRARMVVGAGLRTAIGVPIAADDVVVGTLEFMSRELRYIDEDLLQLLMTFGSQFGLFIQRHRAEEEVRAQKALLDAQNDSTLDGVLVVGPDGAIRSYNRRFVEMWDISEKALSAGTNVPPMEEAIRLLVDPDAFTASTQYLYEHPDDRSKELLHLIDGRVFERRGGPVRAPDGTYYGRAWFFRDVTDQTRAERQLLAATERARFLAEATEILTASLDPTATMQGLAHLAVPYLADVCTIDVLERAPTFEPRRATAVYASDDLEARDGSPEWDFSATAFEVMRTGRPVIVPYVSATALTARVPDDAARALAPVATIIVPLPAGPTILGAISFHRVGAGAHYDEDDLALAEDLGRRAALAVDNARLYADRSHVARTLQASLLPPHLPVADGLSLGARYHPAGRGLEVGGDFYDVFSTDGEWVVVTGDVCGKGAEAAAATALARYTLRASALQARRPSRVLRMLNDAMLSQAVDSRFCTVVYARVRQLDEGGARMTLACGGHPLPLLLRADGTVRQIGTPGTVMGVFAEPSLTDRTLSLARGDSVIFYTDGVIDARGEEGPFGEERMMQTVERCRGMGAQELADELAGAALAWENGQPRDDIAVVVLKVER